MSRYNQTKFESTEVSLVRAGNGWIVSAEYKGLYDKPASLIAATVEEAIKFASDLMTKPFVRQDD
jgi:hypothetical protein